MGAQFRLGVGLISDASRMDKGRSVGRGALLAGFAFLGIALVELIGLRARLRDGERSIPSVLALDSDSGGSRPQLVFVFRPGDCPAALAVIDRWNEIAKEGRVRVRGLMIAVSPDTGSLRSVIESYRIHFPVRFVDPKALARLDLLGDLQLPLTLVLDERYAIRAIVPTTARSELQLHGLMDAVVAATSGSGR